MLFTLIKHDTYTNPGELRNQKPNVLFGQLLTTKMKSYQCKNVKIAEYFVFRQTSSSKCLALKLGAVYGSYFLQNMQNLFFRCTQTLC